MMDPSRAIFTVRSVEMQFYPARHRCIDPAMVDGNKLRVDLIPAIPRWVYERSASHLSGDLDQIVLAPRYVGTSLTPAISEWPCTVNICIPKPGGSWEDGPWILLDIGLLKLPDANATGA